MDARLVREGMVLLDQQMWCLGRDCAGPANLLLEAGFRRTRALDGRCSQYDSPVPGGHVYLWGFGVLLLEGTGAVFLDRDRFGPEHADATALRVPAHCRDALAPSWPATVHHQQQVLRLAARLARWLGGYEAAVLGRQGAAWRAMDLAARSRPPRFSPQEVPGRWSRLADALDPGGACHAA
ncbi:MAG: hypothetical protein FJ086_01585 [Deltaproteobacteria bacterium]|nr:hypothetical protein [Deltaproteobacteria bacterium]